MCAPPAVYPLQGFTPRHHDPGVCEDTSNQCGEWAKNGGCEKNKDFMIVTVAGPGACRKTCGACKVCAPDDKVGVTAK
jgi:prolyl 4-hydroxylase